MKILHTADWHIGKILHKYNLEDDHRLFFDWLIQLIIDQKIELLLVAGDIFDTTNPSNTSLAMYYNFLKSLLPTGCQVIITGGNHDSPSLLNAPREILQFLDIQVIGAAQHPIENQLLEIKNKQNQLALVVAAVPYLRDIDLRKSVSGENYEDKVTAIREGIKRYYENLATIAQEKYANVPSIAMGHLYVRGVTTSDSEREIHAVGGEAAFSSNNFPSSFDYIALGHIHKSQRIADSDWIRYSGSPVPLSFSEREDKKYVIILNLEDGKLTDNQLVEVPKFRELRRFSGTIDEVWEALRNFTPSTPLMPLLEVAVEELDYDPMKAIQYNLLQQEFEDADFKIIKPTIRYKNRLSGADELFSMGENIQDLSFRDVFLKRIENEELPDETRQLLVEAFDELCQEIFEE
jgi:DNA repair protein SbcD/Mre11